MFVTGIAACGSSQAYKLTLTRHLNQLSQVFSESARVLRI